MFPEELTHRLIQMFAFVSDTVLDPLLGSGTTSLAARNLGRNSIGYEINADFIPSTKEKLNINQPDIVGTTFEFVNQETSIDFEKQIMNLPSIFKDSHKLDKRIDPKKLQFGSRMDNKGKKFKKDYYAVKKIDSVEK